MDPNTFPTKGNLIAAKNSLKLATMGYGLMDKKRNILIRELMGLIDEAKGIQSEIDTVFKAAYEALQSANIELGINYVQENVRSCGRYGKDQGKKYHGNGNPSGAASGKAYGAGLWV